LRTPLLMLAGKLGFVSLRAEVLSGVAYDAEFGLDLILSGLR
jgi:hypothetical protein